jgi:hypothetical protein
MRMSKPAVVAVAVAAALIITVTLSVGAEAPDAEKKHKMIIKTSDASPVELDLDTLADGESRTFDLDKGRVTATRRGDQIELEIDDGEGKVKKMLLSGDGDASKVFIARAGKGCAIATAEGDEAHKMMWVGEGGKAFAIGHAEGEAGTAVDVDGDVFTVHKHRVMIKEAEGHDCHLEGDEGHMEVTVMATEGDEGLVDIWLSHCKDKVSFHCPDDETTLSVDAEKVTPAGFACPVCGRSMEKVEHHQPRVMRRIVTEEEKQELL